MFNLNVLQGNKCEERKIQRDGSVQRCYQCWIIEDYEIVQNKVRLTCWILSMYVLSRPVVSDSCHPKTLARQAPLSMGFSQQEYQSGLPFPSPGDFPPRNWTQISGIVGRLFTDWAIREASKFLSSECNLLKGTKHFNVSISILYSYQL